MGSIINLKNHIRTDRYRQFDEILNEIIERRRQPQDRYEVTAILESMGWNDERVYTTFGLGSVFVLGEQLWGAIQNKVIYSSFSVPKQTSWLLLTRDLIITFLRGLIFALPMALSVVSMLTLRFSLWSYYNLSIDLATCIAIGTILSFMITGGFTQAIARRGFYYISQGHYNMGRKSTFFFIRTGYAASIGVSVLMYLVNVVFNVFPQSMFLIIVLYFFSLSSVWLAVSVMYILRKEFLFTGLILFGIFIVFILFRWLHWDIIVAQLVSLTVVSIIGLILVQYLFKREERREERDITPKTSRLSVTVHSILPYFAYGFMYFSFLFADRFLAWSADRSWIPDAQYMPYFIWFRGDYELGLNFALLVLMIPLGVNEVIVHKFMLGLEWGQKQFLGFETGRMNGNYRKTYYKMLVVMSAITLANVLLIYVLLMYFNDGYAVYTGKQLISSPKTYFVFFWSLAGYVILAIGLMNSTIMFALSQPSYVNRAILPALLVNIVVGFVLSRWVDYSWAVIGMVAGSVIFSVLTFRNLRHLLGKLDWCLYAAS